MTTGKRRHRLLMPPAIGLLLNITFVLAPQGAAAEDQHVFYDYAPVLETTPILQPVSVPVQQQQCRNMRLSAGSHSDLVALAGDVRASAPGITLGNAIRQGRPSTSTTSLRCETIQTYETRQRVVAYQVRYRLGDDVFVRRMPHDPGDRVRVRVQLHPQP